MKSRELTACQRVECVGYGKRYHDSGTFCQHCGTKLMRLHMCCADETIQDDGYCVECGAAKQLRFVETA